MFDYRRVTTIWSGYVHGNLPLTPWPPWPFLRSWGPTWWSLEMSIPCFGWVSVACAKLLHVWAQNVLFEPSCYNLQVFSSFWTFLKSASHHPLSHYDSDLGTWFSQPRIFDAWRLPVPPRVPGVRWSFWMRPIAWPKQLNRTPGSGKTWRSLEAVCWITDDHGISKKIRSLPIRQECPSFFSNTWKTMRIFLRILRILQYQSLFIMRPERVDEIPMSDGCLKPWGFWLVPKTGLPVLSPPWNE